MIKFPRNFQWGDQSKKGSVQQAHISLISKQPKFQQFRSSQLFKVITFSSGFSIFPTQTCGPESVII